MDDRTSGLLDSIYGAIGDDMAFAGLPHSLSDLISSDSAWILKHESGRTMVEASHNISLDHLAAYEKYYQGVDPFLRPIEHMPMAKALSFERLVPADEYHRTEFFNDYIRPNRLGEDLIGACFRIGDAMIATTFHRTGAEPFGAADEERLQAIIPHLQRMFTSRAAIAHRVGASLFSETLFQEANDAVLLCDATQRVMHLNRAARGLPFACASIGRDGRLVFKSNPAQKAFIASVDQVSRRRISTTFDIPRQNKLPYRVEVNCTQSASATVVVNILDVERQLQRRIERAQQLYLFTPSECALAESLMRGHTPEEHAALRGTVLSTVRSQLHIMFAKSKTHRQGELIAALTLLT